MKDQVTVVDLALRRAKERPPSVRLVLELWRIDDGRVAYDAYVEELVEAERPRVTTEWLRSNLRWALLQYAKLWRMGLRVRRRGER